MANGLNALLGFHERALDMRAYRQQLLASNIANADTPNYKAVDVDFAKALQNAQSAHGKLPLSATGPNHLPAPSVNPLNAQLMYRSAVQPSIDGNTVDTDIEMGQFSDNAIRYQAGLTFLSHEIKMMMTALQGQ